MIRVIREGEELHIGDVVIPFPALLGLKRFKLKFEAPRGTEVRVISRKLVVDTNTPTINPQNRGS